MAALTLRLVKGSPLTNSELDSNFTALNTELGQKLVSSDLSPYLLSATAASTYQPILVSGTSIKTINGSSLLGSGNITVQTSITSSDVTTALGYTPYNSTNPSGYVTQAGARSAISASGSLSYNSTTGVISYTTPNSDGITEGTTNLFFTNARARSAISVSGSLSYNSTTGVISYTQPTNVSTFTNDSGYITSSALSPYLTSATAASTYQTISGMSSYLTTSTAASTYATAANPTFSGLIKGDFTNATYSSRVMVQTTTTNGNTFFGLLPNGTSVNSQFHVWGSSDPNNAPLGAMTINATALQLQVTATGTGTQLPFRVLVGSNEVFRATTGANFLIGTTTDNGTDKLQVNGSVSATSFSGAGTGLTGTASSLSIGGNAGTATKWATARTETLSGDVTGSATVDGSANWSITTTLANSGVTAGTYGSATNIPQIAVDAKGRITSVSNVAVSIPSGSLTFTGDVTGSGSTGSTTTLTLAASGVTAGTYTKVTVDAKGRVTSGTSLASADLPTYTGSLTSSQVTTALGFTPYNSTNPNGYITSSASITGSSASAPLLSNSGQYIWSASTLPTSYSLGVQTSFVQGSNGWQSYGSVMTMNTYSGGGGALQLYVPYSPTYGGTGLQVRFGNYDVSSGNSWTSWKTLLASDNYNSYAPTLTGTGASGTWGINVTGSAGSASTATTATNLSGGNINGLILNQYNSQNARLYTAAAGAAGLLGVDSSATFRYQIYGDGSNWGFLNAAWGGWDLQKANNGQLLVTVSSVQQTVLHSGNYTSYSPSLTGSGASGTWGINITGNAATASNGGVTSVNGSTGAVTVSGGQYYGTAATKAIAYNSDTISENITINSGTNGLSAGPITISTGYTVTVNGNWSIV